MSGSETLATSQQTSYVCMQNGNGSDGTTSWYCTVWSHGPNSMVNSFPRLRFLIGRQSLMLSGCCGGGGTGGAGGSAEELDAAGGCDAAGNAAAISVDTGLVDCSA